MPEDHKEHIANTSYTTPWDLTEQIVNKLKLWWICQNVMQNIQHRIHKEVMPKFNLYTTCLDLGLKFGLHY